MQLSTKIRVSKDIFLLLSMDHWKRAIVFTLSILQYDNLKIYVLMTSWPSSLKHLYHFLYVQHNPNIWCKKQLLSKIYAYIQIMML